MRKDTFFPEQIQEKTTYSKNIIIKITTYYIKFIHVITIYSFFESSILTRPTSIFNISAFIASLKVG